MLQMPKRPAKGTTIIGELNDLFTDEQDATSQVKDHLLTETSALNYRLAGTRGLDMAHLTLYQRAISIPRLETCRKKAVKFNNKPANDRLKGCARHLSCIRRNVWLATLLAQTSPPRADISSATATF
jgi:hypothetical protein